jgi:transposase-like protein
MSHLSKISKAAFHDEAAAFTYLEATLWPDGPICPHCGTIGNATRLQTAPAKPGKRAARIGLWKCKSKQCRKQFRVTVGTVFEHGRIPLHKMLQAVYLLCCSKKGISSHQLHRVLGITYRAAWFLSHRIREAMRTGALSPMGGGGEIIEIDETFTGRLEGMPKQPTPGGASSYKNTVLTLVERGGSVRSFHVEGTASGDLLPIIRANISKEAFIMSDENAAYRSLEKEFWMHQTVNHAIDEYMRGIVGTNTVEGYFSIFKRGMKGVYQHCAEKHLHRYLAEFDFRYSNRMALGVDDTARAIKALKGITGKRLTYRTSPRHGEAVR